LPDLLAGTTVNALDTPPVVADAETGQYTFTNTTFGVGTTGGTYADCGVAFVAPTTGRVVIMYVGQLSNSVAGGATIVAPVVRTGGTVGSGSSVLAASDNEAVTTSFATSLRGSAHTFLSGLTPGDTYNVRLEHRVNANTGTAERRRVTVLPCS
jgi:hypothetical protein